MQNQMNTIFDCINSHLSPIKYLQIYQAALHSTFPNFSIDLPQSNFDEIIQWKQTTHLQPSLINRIIISANHQVIVAILSYLLVLLFKKKEQLYALIDLWTKYNWIDCKNTPNKKNRNYFSTCPLKQAPIQSQMCRKRKVISGS